MKLVRLLMLLGPLGVCGSAQVVPQPPPVVIPETVKSRIDEMALPSNCGKPDFSCLFETYFYKTSCLGPDLTTSLSRQFMSASETVAWAVRTALKEPANKYKAVAYLELGQCGDLYGHSHTDRNDIAVNRLAAYEYVVNNYVAGWRDDDPWNHHSLHMENEGAGYKVGETYLNSKLDDCDHRNELTMIDIARPGIAAVVCADENGDPGSKEGCTPELIGPGTFNLATIIGSKGVNLNDHASYLHVYRK